MKNKLKIIKLILFVGLICEFCFFLLGCSEEPKTKIELVEILHIEEDTLKTVEPIYNIDIQTELPPGYKILCNIQGEYVGEMRYGSKLYHYSTSEVNFQEYVPFDTYQEAVDRCWDQYNYRPGLPDTVDYYNCDEMKSKK